MNRSSLERRNIFICYSHKDTRYLDRLHVHLADLERKGVIIAWSDKKIAPGAQWHEEIKRAIASAKIAVLLISADFLASQFIAEDELPPLLEAAEIEGMVILPVILSPCTFGYTKLAQFEAVNDINKPVIKMNNFQKEELWSKVTKTILDSITEPNVLQSNFSNQGNSKRRINFLSSNESSIQELWDEITRLRRELELAKRINLPSISDVEPALPLRIFYCYAREDEALRDKMETHLASLKRQGLILSWHDRMISAGQEWNRVIGSRLNTADIILLLISQAFMASDYCYGVEMKKALERHERGEARVIPIILQQTFWEKAPFSKLQVLPTDGLPITEWSNEDDAFKDIQDGIEKAIVEFHSYLRTSQVTPISSASSLSHVNTPPDFKILTVPIFQSHRPTWIDVDAKEQPIEIKNIGRENAYHIYLVLFGCETYLNPVPILQKHNSLLHDSHWRGYTGSPVEPGETVTLTLMGYRDKLDGKQKIGVYRLYAPQEPDLNDVMHNPDLPFHSARLTLTYRDRFGNKYAQTFDYNHSTKIWIYLSHPTVIAQDFFDLLSEIT